MTDLKRANSPLDGSAVADRHPSWLTVPKTVSGSLAHAQRLPRDPSSIGGGVDAGEALAQGEDLVTG